nr:hypothetical protein [Palleronia pontilimi]
MSFRWPKLSGPSGIATKFSGPPSPPLRNGAARPMTGAEAWPGIRSATVRAMTRATSMVSGQRPSRAR